MLDVIGYIMTLLGDWERGPGVIREAMNRNPYYKPVSHYALWLDCLNRRDFVQAYQETLLMIRPTIFWHPLAKAATLGLLGRSDEGREHIELMLELQPDFVKRGKILIRKYIKFKNLEDLVVQGLSSCGLEIDSVQSRQ